MIVILRRGSQRELEREVLVERGISSILIDHSLLLCGVDVLLVL